RRAPARIPGYSARGPARPAPPGRRGAQARMTSRFTMIETSRSAIPSVLLAALALAACAGKEEPAHASTAQLPASLALASAHARALPVKEVGASAKTGDEVVVTGRMGVEGSDRAYFSLVDPSLKACSETPLKDPCPTPWDFCCSPPEELSKLSALIQFKNGA